MELHENRTEVERVLADVWQCEDRTRSKTGLPKWLFAGALTCAVIAIFWPSTLVAPVMTAVAPAPEEPSVDKVSSENVVEDLDYRIAQHANSMAGWRAFLDAHPDGPHAEAAHAEIERLLPTPPPQPVEVTEQSPPSPAATPAPVQAAQSPPSPAATPTPVEAEQSLPPPAATQTPVEAAQSPAPSAPTPVMAEKAPAQPPTPTVAPFAAAASAPPPLLRPREIAPAKVVEPAHHSHRRPERRQAEPSILAILVAQLFHGHR